MHLIDIQAGVMGASAVVGTTIPLAAGYALHGETWPPPRQDDGFALTGRAREIFDPQVSGVVRGQVRAERNGELWPGFEEEALFELGIERCLLMQTRADGAFPAGPTSWRAGDRWHPEADDRSDMVT